MKFVNNLSEKEYKEFLDSFPYSHFLQSVTWGETNRTCRDKIPCYVGLKDDSGKLLAAALLLKKKVIPKLCYYYCPRGYLIDFNNKELLKTFTEEIKQYMKRTGGIYVKINPEIMYQEIDDDANRINNGKNNKKIFDNLINLGYRHQGFVKLYENNEPRYTFRRYFEKYNSKEEIDSSLSKTFMNTVKRSNDYNFEIDFDGNVSDFFELNKSNALKDGFIQYSDKFYKTLYKNGKKYDNIKVFNVFINCKEQYLRATSLHDEVNHKINNNEFRKKELADAKDKLARLTKEIEFFEPYKDKEKMCVCSLINGIVGDMLWTMYIGNNSLGEKTFAVNRIYYETIMYCYNHGFKFMDLYGTVGDPKTTYKNLGGLHAYKKKFGDTYIEFIGEFDLVNKTFWYKVLPIFLKVYRSIKRKMSK